MSFALAVDWDGTVTERDAFVMALERFGDRAAVERLSRDFAAGKIGYRELMEGEAAAMRGPLDDVVRWLLRHARIRRGFGELVARRRPLVLSSGFHELIDPLLVREGLDVEVVANRLEPGPDGWRVVWRDPRPCEVCGDVCKRRLLPPGPVVYVGDGYSDRCAAEAADRVFARPALADYLRERGVPSEPFDDFFQVAARLDP